jgi:hypothetical protein
MARARTAALTTAPRLDASAHTTQHRAIAAHAWSGLLVQEERSRLTTARLVQDLRRFDAPQWILDDAARVAEDEACHVQICAHVVRALGFECKPPPLTIPELPTDAMAFERAMIELLVAGFAVAETMSVGGFTAVRQPSSEPLIRWAYTTIARDEVRHGIFGEKTSAWAIRNWSPARRKTLWPVCVRAMEGVERRAGGPIGADPGDERSQPLEALGVPGARTTEIGLLRSIRRNVLPRLARLGVLPATA